MAKRSFLLLALATLTGCASLPPFPALPGTLWNQTRLQGSIAVALELPDRKIQALPDGTDRVDVSVSSAGLVKPIVQTIFASQFTKGRALMQIDRLPVGHVRVDATVFDSAGDTIVLGNAQTDVVEGQTTQVNLLLVVKAPSGNLVVNVDTKLQQDTPVIYIGLAPGSSSTPLTTQTTLTVSPDEGWGYGMSLGANQPLLITKTGRVALVQGSTYSFFGPAGCSACSGSLAPELPGLALLGRFTPDGTRAGRVFLLGTRFEDPEPGVLEIGINSKAGGAYAGSFTVQLKPI